MPGIVIVLWAMGAAFAALVLLVMLALLGKAVDRYRSTKPADPASGIPEALPPAAPDNEAGINLGDHDDCELIHDMPAYEPTFEERLDRLRRVVRDEQQKGEQA